MYTKGSSALKTEYYTYDETKQRKTASVKAVPSKKAYSRKKVKQIKKRIVAAAMLMFTMAFVVLFRYGAIAKEYSELSSARAELELINAKVVETRMKAEGNLDMKKIEQEAERLGLRPPMKNQIKYISLGNTDNGEVLKTEETNVLSAFINRMSVILEYLY
ncbi:MAG: hypothetical protein IJE41_01625 [Clostridia bacterium]|nr:hypothetical protein [Clostridia bacterium]